MFSLTFAKRAIVLCASVCVLALATFAQTTGSLSGTIHDTSGAAVAGAKVTVSDLAQNRQVDATTGADGTFSFTTLLPGTYSVTIEAQGFKKSIKSGIVLNIADRQSTGVIKLEVGGIENTAKITADSRQNPGQAKQTRRSREPTRNCHCQRFDRPRKTLFACPCVPATRSSRRRRARVRRCAKAQGREAEKRLRTNAKTLNPA